MTPWSVTSIGNPSPEGTVTAHGVVVEPRIGVQPGRAKSSASTNRAALKGSSGHGTKSMVPIPAGSGDHVPKLATPKRPQITKRDGRGLPGGCATANDNGCPTP